MLFLQVKLMGGAHVRQGLQERLKRYKSLLESTNFGSSRDRWSMVVHDVRLSSKHLGTFEGPTASTPTANGIEAPSIRSYFPHAGSKSDIYGALSTSYASVRIVPLLIISICSPDMSKMPGDCCRCSRYWVGVRHSRRTMTHGIQQRAARGDHPAPRPQTK